MKKRRRKNYSLVQSLGWAPSKPTKTGLRQWRREHKARVAKRVKEIRSDYARMAKSARAGFKDKTKLERLFHEVYGRGENPRTLPEVTDAQLAAFEKLITGSTSTMAQKKRKSKKKKNSRKGKMPAGLKAYWAKKRRAKNSRRRTRKKARNPRRRTRTRTIIRYRTRIVKVRAKRRRRKSNPRRKAQTLRIKAPAGLGPKGLRKFRALAAKAYGVPARIVKR